MSWSSAWVVLAVVCAAAAAWWASGPTRRGGSSWSGWRRIARWWPPPRPDSASWQRRAALAAPVGVGAGVALWLLARASPVVAVLLAVAVSVAATIVLGRVPDAASQARKRRLQADLPQCWELLAAGLDAGLPMRVALAEVVAVADGPVADELGQVLTRIRLGDAEDVAWRSLGDHPQLGPAGRDLARSVASGTSVVDLLNEYAVQAREDRHAAAEADAKAIGVRAVLPLMVCFLPAFFLIGVVPIVAGAVLPLLAGW